MEMTGWLAGKRVRLAGEEIDLVPSLKAAGATIVPGGESDCLVHVARASEAKLAHEQSHDEWRRAIGAGLDRPFEQAKAFNEAARKAGRGGAILFVGSPEQQGGAAQAAAAGALCNLTKSLAVEWARDGIRVNAILSNHEGPTLGRLAAYLLSDYAAYVTGMVTGIDLTDDFLR